VAQDSEEPNIGRALAFLRRRGLWIVLCCVLASAAAFGLSKHQTKKYTATASVVFSNNQLNQEIAGLSSNSNTSVSQQQESNLELLRLGHMTTKTVAILGHGLTEQEVGESLSISEQAESNIAIVSATTVSPVLSANIANTYTKQFVKEQEQTNREYYKAALALVHKQLASLSPQQRDGTDGVELQDRAQSLGLLSALPPNTAQIAQLAPIPTSPSSPKTSRNTLIGAVLGLFLGLCLALLLERLDPRIRNPEELEATYHLPLLGVVPRSEVLSQEDTSTSLTLPLAETEAFYMIRARLRSLHAEGDIRTVLVASAASNEGKTTIACHLAGAAARMGSRVLLLEANLRHPRLAPQFGILSQMGLADVLSGAIAMDGATQPIETSRAGTDKGSLDVLPSGPSIPSNPVELIESRSMNILLAQAKSEYDLIVIDTPELTAVSDAFLLLPKVDGVVIVGRVGRSRRDVAEHLRQVLDASGAPLVGVIANDVKAHKHLHPGASRSHNPKADNLVTRDISVDDASVKDGSIPSAKAEA
jgi:capsular exopolysaccharide synthesis family protein